MYKYKSYILGLLAAICMQSASGQVTTNLVVRSAPTDLITMWDNDNSIINYIVNSQNPDQFQAIIKTELKTSDGTVIATKNLVRAQLYTITSGSHVYYASDVLPLDDMIFSGSYQRLLARLGKLSPGNYQLTVQLVSPQGYAPLSQPQTKFFYIREPLLPVLMKPYNNEKLRQEEAQTAIIFRWTPESPITSDIPNYHLQVFEILDNQQDVQALRANQPLLDQVLRGQTQYIWRPQLAFIADTSKRFIWTIQTLDVNGNPVLTTTGNGEARSEPFVFEILPAMSSKVNNK